MLLIDSSDLLHLALYADHSALAWSGQIRKGLLRDILYYNVGKSRNDLALLQHAFNALRRTTGIEGQLVAAQVAGLNGRRADALVEIAIEDKCHQYVAALKRVDRFVTLGIIKHQLDQYDMDVVPPMLVYADLMATHDPRNLDTAQLLYERKIAYAVRQA